MRSLDTIRWRIILGLSGLLAGLVIASVVGVTSLATLRRSLGEEIARLRESSEVGNGLVTAVFDEIRAAEQYLGERGQQANDRFQAAVDSAFSYQKTARRPPGAYRSRSDHRQPHQAAAVRHSCGLLARARRSRRGSDPASHKRWRSAPVRKSPS